MGVKKKKAAEQFQDPPRPGSGPKVEADAGSDPIKRQRQDDEGGLGIYESPNANKSKSGNGEGTGKGKGHGNSKGKGKGKGKGGWSRRAEKEDMKRRLMEINREIARCGQQKMLAEAVHIFDGLAAKGITPTLHTYTALLNAYVRKGDHDGAKKLFQQLRDEGFQPNTVTYTTLLKSACSLPDLSEACELLTAMREEGVEINLRTLNTFLRGCLRVGNLAEALKAHKSFAEGSGDETVDTSAHEALMRLMTSALRIEEAEVMQDGLKGQEAASNAAPWLMLAESLALLNKPNRARKALKRAKTLLSKPQHRQTSDEYVEGQDEFGHGGASPSVEMFLRHRQKELELEASELETLLKSEEALQRARSSLAANLAHFVYLRPGTTKLDAKGTADAVSNELELVGLQGLRPKSQAKTREQLSRTVCASDSVLNVEGLLQQEEVGGSSPSRPPRQKRAVRIEVCSGNGDWVVEQAEASQDRADWIALELRHDRCVHISRKATKMGLRNLVVVGGDAGDIIPNRFPKNLASHIYVNFPEPPAWHERSGQVDSSHLLTKDFLRSLGKILKPKGRLIIVSDNQSYLEKLLKDLEGLHDVFEEPAADLALAGSKKEFHKDLKKNPKGAIDCDDSSDSAMDAFIGNQKERKLNNNNNSNNSKAAGSKGPPLPQGQQKDSIAAPALKLSPGLPERSEETGLDAPFGESYFHRLWARGHKKQRRFHIRLTRRSADDAAAKTSSKLASVAPGSSGKVKKKIKKGKAPLKA